jgi:hypothetical protein
LRLQRQNQPIALHEAHHFSPSWIEVKVDRQLFASWRDGSNTSANCITPVDLDFASVTGTHHAASGDDNPRSVCYI